MMSNVVFFLRACIASQMRLERKKSKPVNKSFFNVVSKVKNAKSMQGSGRGKIKIE